MDTTRRSELRGEGGQEDRKLKLKRQECFQSRQFGTIHFYCAKLCFTICLFISKLHDFRQAQAYVIFILSGNKTFCVCCLSWVLVTLSG